MGNGDKQAEKKEKRQPWKGQWPPRGPTQPASNQAKTGEPVILLEGGGAYPNKIKETEGSRL